MIEAVAVGLAIAAITIAAIVAAMFGVVVVCLLLTCAGLLNKIDNGIAAQNAVLTRVNVVDDSDDGDVYEPRG
jgi:hypothetical protein